MVPQDAFSTDKAFCLKVVTLSREFYGQLPLHLQDDPDILQAFVRSDRGRIESVWQLVPEHHHAKVLLQLLVEREQEFLNANDEINMTDSLRSDKDFIMSAVKARWDAIYLAPVYLQEDYDVMLVAVGYHPDFLLDFENRYGTSEHQQRMRIARFAVQVRERLRTLHSFLLLLLGIRGSKSSSCHLCILDQGEDTCRSYKKMIAKFAGVRMQDDLQLLKGASLNLTRWGY